MSSTSVFLLAQVTAFSVAPLIFEAEIANLATDWISESVARNLASAAMQGVSAFNFGSGHCQPETEILVVLIYQKGIY